MVFKVSLIIFLASVGIWLLWPVPYMNIIAGISAVVAALGTLIEGIGYFAGVLAGLWFLFAGYKRFPSLP